MSKVVFVSCDGSVDLNKVVSDTGYLLEETILIDCSNFFNLYVAVWEGIIKRGDTILVDDRTPSAVLSFFLGRRDEREWEVRTIQKEIFNGVEHWKDKEI